jgi:hemerythrin
MDVEETMIQWDKQYETGIKTIDDQHKEWIKITGNLSDLLTEAVEGDDIYDEMVDIIESLAAYTVYHFNYEEELFHKLNYELMDGHIKEHNKMISEIESLDLRAVDEDQISHGKKILKTLISWLFKHISGSDFLYKDLFESNGV